MPTTENITTTYAGEHAGKYISAALFPATSLVNGAVSIRPNVKFKEVVSRLEVASAQADATCDFTDVGTVTLTERILEPKSLQVNMELCKANYRDTWEAISMGYSAHDNLPPSFADYLIGLVAAKVADNNEVNIWSGSAGNSGEFDGFETLLAADAALPAANEVTGTTVTAANVVAEIQKVVDAIPSRIYGQAGLSIRVSQKIAKAYIAAQAALGYLDRFNVGQTELNFQGVPLVVCPGMTDDVMVAGISDNFSFGTGLLSDHNLVKVLDMADLDGSQNVRLVMRFTAGVQYGIASEIITYGITNSAN